MQPTIQRLAEEAREARGSEWVIAHLALSGYVHKLSDAEFEEEIGRVTNHQIFGILWSVGLSMHRQEVAAMRDKELKK